MEQPDNFVREIVVPNHPDILPNCIPKNIKKVQRRGQMNWVPIFCANCGADGGLVPDPADVGIGGDFAFYMCQPCAEKWSPLTNTYLVPDEVFWDKVKKAQLEKYGRELTGPEVAEALTDGDSMLSKLARERR